MFEKMYLRPALIMSAIILAASADGKVVPSNLIGDNMVLQQNADVRLWGSADPGARLVVKTSWSDATATCKADSRGKWEVTVKTPRASFTPQTVTISDGTPLTLNDVLIGEVWLASGQSNMEMPLKGFGG